MPNQAPIRIEQQRRGHVVRGLVAAAALVIVIAGLRSARPVVVPMLVAAFVAFACLPAVNKLRSWRVPKVLSVVFVVLGVVAVVFAIAAFVGSSLTAFVQTLPVYQARLGIQVADLMAWFAERGFDVPDSAQLQDTIDPGVALSLVATLLNGVGDTLANGLLILLTVVFILLEASSFRVKAQRAFRREGSSFPQIDAFASGMKQYLVIKTMVSLVTGILVAVWLAILGVDFPLLWGLLAFLLNYIPNIGSILAAIPASLLALVQISIGAALLVVLGFLVINVVMGNMIEPRWMGRGVGLSPLVVFFSLIFWGWVLGPMGLILSVPLSVTLKIALESSDETRWVAVLLGPETVQRELEPLPKPVASDS